MSPTTEHLLEIQAAARIIDARAATLTPTLPTLAERIHSIVYDLLDVLDEAARETNRPTEDHTHDATRRRRFDRTHRRGARHS